MNEQLELFDADAIEGDGQPKPWRLIWGDDQGTDTRADTESAEPGQDAA